MYVVESASLWGEVVIFHTFHRVFHNDQLHAQTVQKEVTGT